MVPRPPPVASFSLCGLRLFVIKRISLSVLFDVTPARPPARTARARARARARAPPRPAPPRPAAAPAKRRAAERPRAPPRGRLRALDPGVLKMVRLQAQ